MITLKLNAPDYQVAEALSEITAKIEGEDLLTPLYNGDKDKLTVVGDDYTAEFEYEYLDCDFNTIKVGSKVIWYDPEEEARDLEREYIVDGFRGDIICISDEFSEAEAFADELRVIG